jgi:hypothetical protein
MTDRGADASSGGRGWPGLVGIAEAARAALAARAGGRPVVVVARADEEGAGRRLLAWGPGDARGTLGSQALDRAGLELALALLGAAPDGLDDRTPAHDRVATAVAGPEATARSSPAATAFPTHRGSSAWTLPSLSLRSCPVPATSWCW